MVALKCRVWWIDVPSSGAAVPLMLCPGSIPARAGRHCKTIQLHCHCISDVSVSVPFQPECVVRGRGRRWNGMESGREHHESHVSARAHSLQHWQPNFCQVQRPHPPSSLFLFVIPPTETPWGLLIVESVLRGLGLTSAVGKYVVNL